MTNTTPTRKAKFIVERDGERCLVMWPSGDVRSYPDPASVLAAIKRSEKATAARHEGICAFIAVIEWRDGLQPPAENA